MPAYLHGEHVTAGRHRDDVRVVAERFVGDRAVVLALEVLVEVELDEMLDAEFLQ